VRLLERAGLIEASHLRSTTRRSAMVYARTSAEAALVYDPSSSRATTAIVRTAAAVLRQAERTFRRAVDARLLACAGEKPNALVRAQKVWLGDSDVEHVRKAVERLSEELRRRSRPGHGRLYLLTWLLSPIAPGQHAKRAVS
jgi:hypothetical protein